MYELLTRYPSPELLETLANAVACDYLRHCNVDERPRVMAEIERLRPDVARVIRERYSHHAQ